MRKWMFALALCLCLLLCSAALADTAADITKAAKLTSTNDAGSLSNLTDGNHKTIWRSKRGYVQLDLPKGQRCYGLYLCQSRDTDRFLVEAADEAGVWTPVYQSEGSYLHEYTPIPGAQSIRIKASGNAMMTLTEVRLYGEGDVPDTVQRWETLEGKADLMLVSAHPDDEYIWFGGAIPTYAGERGKKVQLVYFCFGEARRKNELLDGLWTCGVKYYPVIGGYKDRMYYNRQSMYDIWGGTKTVYPWLVTQLRKYRPDVVLTHDLDGEYGHGAHQVAAMASINCIERAATDYDAKSLAEYGAWQVKKLYLHLYPENALLMDWHTPLQAFGGKTSLEVAELGLDKHVSQHALTYQMLESGPYDCRKFGLYMSTVGEDVQKNDFFENIP